jgi:5-methylcytosine-specific restriction enzyme A
MPLKAFDTIFQEYIPSSTEVVDGKIRRRRVLPTQEMGADAEIRKTLPALLREAIKISGRAVDDFRVYGSVGQINYYLAKIPWVAALDRRITNSTEHGYYIVLLFREDMQGCVLSLNQGFTEYDRVFGTPTLATKKIREGAQLALSYLKAPPTAIRGEIDLHATAPLGKGYEQGAIVSKSYAIHDEVSAEQVIDDCLMLLKLHDQLYESVGPSIIKFLSPAADDEFQEAAAELSKSKDTGYREPPPGPVPRTAPVDYGPRAGYRRDVRVSAEALLRGDYCCEIDAAHITFTSKATKRNFVEAHHLVPMEHQDTFDASLDILENVVVLCPTCHRKLHHGLPKDRLALLKSLLGIRSPLLSSRGLDVSLKQLLELYHSHLLED